MADVRGVEDGGGEAADGDRDAPAGQLLEERRRCLDLCSGGPPVGAFATRVRRHDVPEKYVILTAKPLEYAMNDARRGLSRTGARELTLGRERNPAHASAAVAGGFPDEDDLGMTTQLDVRAKPLTQQRRSRVLVVRLADARGCEPAYEVGYHSGKDFGRSTRRRGVHPVEPRLGFQAFERVAGFGK